MAERQRASRQKQGEEEQKHRANQKDYQTSLEWLHAWDHGPISMIDTPFLPRMDEHAALLSIAQTGEQRANMTLHLQRTYGNRYVQRLIESMGAQAKLTVSAPNDVYEQEADRVAESVTKAINSRIQPQAEEEEEEVIQMQLAESESATVSEELETSINNARGNGQPLSDIVREPMERAFGADFSGVRVHTDSEADLLNQHLGARAFTTGQDIFFRQGEYSPGSDSGQKLIAHELTHVVQQGASRANRSGIVQRTIASDIYGYLADNVAKLTTLKNALNALKEGIEINEFRLANMLADPSYDLSASLQLAQEFREEGAEEPYALLLNELQQPLEYTSCYPTAENMFSLIAQGEILDQGANADTYETQAAFEDVVLELTVALELSISEQQASVFRIEYAGHGFILVTRPSDGGGWVVEHLEAIAHTASLMENLWKNPTYTEEDVSSNLMGMASEDIDERREAAEEMGYDANMINLGEDPKYENRVDFPHVRMKWWQRGLSEEWQENWEAQIRERYNMLAQNVAGIEDRL